MRTRRTATPVPGFPNPVLAAGREPAAEVGDVGAGAAGAGLAVERLYPMAPRRTLNARVSADLLERYARLLGGLRGDRLDTSMTEVVHALLHAGPRTQEEVRVLVREWRRARDADP